MSKSNHSTLSKVYPRWITLDSHFQAFRKAGSGTWWQEINNYYERVRRGRWNFRMEQQLLPIYFVAYMLLPQNHAVILGDRFMKMVDDFILVKCGQKGFYQ